MGLWIFSVPFFFYFIFLKKYDIIKRKRRQMETKDIYEIRFKDTPSDRKHLKGYIYDSLVYRYIRAREQMAEYEYEKQIKKEHDKAYYQRQANRDIMRFCQILDEVIGEHD
jgi:hypothetical protein